MYKIKNIIDNDINKYNILSSLDETYIFTDIKKHESNIQNNKSLGIISGLNIDRNNYIFDNDLIYNIYSLRKNFNEFKKILLILFKDFNIEITENPISCYPFTKIIPLASGFITIKIPKN